VLRGLRRQGAQDWHAVSRTGLFEELERLGMLVPTRPLGGEAAAEVAPGWDLVLEHDVVPFVSYPFEWPFGMLRDAAVLHLEVLVEALARNVTTKDGHAYNVQWWGSRPVFIDLSSFTMPADGPWPGYRQFCQTFLNPLFLRAYRGVDHHPWLRGRLEGVAVADARRLLAPRDLLRRGVLRHVVLHGALERRATGPSQATGTAMAEAGFGRELAQAAAGSLRKLVSSLSWRPPASTWSAYGADNSYGPADQARKAAFVEDAVRSGPAGLVWDLGCNDGTYARLAARHAGYVVAVDADHVTVEGLYRSLLAEGNARVLPLVMDLADPTPGLGWRTSERRSLPDRGAPDLVMCLALVHHLAIGANVPVAEVVAWLGSFGCRVVVEFPSRDDPMVRRMLAGKPIPHDDYTVETFESELSRTFTVLRREPLGSGTRTLYLARPR
jgi:SAM-dependent methyltransferase